jgi:hypothetical protein
MSGRGLKGGEVLLPKGARLESPANPQPRKRSGQVWKDCATWRRLRLREDAMADKVL